MILMRRPYPPQTCQAGKSLPVRLVALVVHYITRTRITVTARKELTTYARQNEGLGSTAPPEKKVTFS